MSLIVVTDREDIKSIIKECLDECLDEWSKNAQPPIPEPEQLPDLIEIKEAEVETGYKRSYIYELKEKNAIPFIQSKPHSKVLFSRGELRAWLKTGRPSVIQNAVDQMLGNVLISKGIGSKTVKKSTKR